MIRAALAISLLVSASVRGAIVVEQIEAPVNGGDVVDPTQFPGIKFIASSSAVSIHAQTVGANFYGPNSPAAGDVSTVYETPASTFINNLRPHASTGHGISPAGFPKKVSVANASFVAGLQSPSADLDAIRRLDTLIAHSNVTFVAGAVAGGAFVGDNLLWSARNAIAVHGDDAATPFDPSLAQLPRPHADVYLPGEASYATAEVSSIAAALVSQSPKDARHDVVTRSLIMTGADRSGHYASETANHLDPVFGAGAASATRSERVLAAGEDRAMSVKKGMIAMKKAAGSATAGWSYLKVGRGVSEAIVFHAGSDIAHLEATLNWDVTSKLSGSAIDTSDRATTMADLSLAVYSLTATAKGYALGTEVLASDAKSDNVEHLDFLGDLAAGDYAFVLNGDAKVATNVGFSWETDGSIAQSAQAAPMSSVVVPEPGVMGVVGLVMVGMRRRRRLNHEGHEGHEEDEKVTR